MAETWLDRWQSSRLSAVGVEPRASIESPNTPLTGKELLKAFGSVETGAGIEVSPTGALTHPAVYACVKVITEYIGMLPIQIFKKIPVDATDELLGKKPAPSHPLWPLLHELPNPEMTSQEVVEALAGHVCLRGNAFSHVIRNNAGEVIEIWPLRPDRVWVYRKLGETGEALPGGDLEYIYTPYAGTPIKFAENEIWHVKGLSPDGLLGYSPIQLQAETIGGALATEKYGHKFFANDARPGGILMHPGSLSDKAYNRLMDAINSAHRGFDNSHKMMLLEEGITWEQVGLSPDDAQFLQTRKLGLDDMGRIFRVSARLLNAEAHPSRLSAEDATAEDIRNMVMPWTRRFELSIKRDMLNRPSDKRYFAMFVLTQVQRASLATRTSYYAAGRSNGWLSANDIRVEEGLNPIGPDGDHYMVPMNMVPASQIGKTAQNAPNSDGNDGKAPPTTAKGPASNDPSKGSDNNATKTSSELREAFAPLIADATNRILKRERRDVVGMGSKLLRKDDASTFETWAKDFYGEYRMFMAEALAPAAGSLAHVARIDHADMMAAIDATIDAHVERSLSDVRAAAASEDRITALQALYGDADVAKRSEEGAAYLLARALPDSREEPDGVLDIARRALDLATKRADMPPPVVNIDHHTHIDAGAVQVDSHIEPGAVLVDSHIDKGAIQVNMPKPTGMTVIHGDDGSVNAVLPISE